MPFILQRSAFSNPGRAIVKVITMTTGELDYDVIFHQQEGEEEIAFLPVASILWIIFLVLILILLDNLLVRVCTNLSHATVNIYYDV